MRRPASVDARWRCPDSVAIGTRRRETLYLATVLATFVLGTATGDLTATTIHLGCMTAGVVFAGVICIPGVVYAVTRPIGASSADWTRHC